ncbi:MAG: excisionase family DNA-binding protein [Arachnia sp.]
MVYPGGPRSSSMSSGESGRSLSLDCATPPSRWAIYLHGQFEIVCSSRIMSRRCVWTPPQSRRPISALRGAGPCLGKCRMERAAMRDVAVTSKRVRRWAAMQEAAEYVCCHPKTIRRRVSDGTLNRYRMGRRILVDLDEVDAVMESSASRLAIYSTR